MTTETLTITAFITARIAAVEASMDAPDFIEVDSVRGPGWGNRGDCEICGAYQFDGTEDVTEIGYYEHLETVHQRARVLATCKAHRAIVEAVERHRDGEWEDDPIHNAVLKPLAAIWADHDSYDESWAL